MRRPAFWVIAGALAIGLTSCGGEEDQTPPTPSASPSTTVASPSEKTSSFSTGTVVVQKGKNGNGGKDSKSKNSNAVPGLVQSTDPAERAKFVQNNIKSQKTDRIDPFSSLPPLIAFTTPRVAGTGLSPDARKADSDKSSSVPELPKFPEIKFPDVPSFPKNFGPRPSPSKPASAPLSPSNPSSVPLSPSTPLGIPTLPPIPQPTLARQVEVTGVVKVGNTVQAILKAPNEPTSRYVGVGQMLSNGQILVKRIEINTGSEPIVVLEENGIEVRVMVGSSKKVTP
jgi:hypothetical protein